MESNFTVDPKSGLLEQDPKILFVQTRADSTKRWRTISTFVKQDDRFISPHPCSFRLQDKEVDLFGNLIVNAAPIHSGVRWVQGNGLVDRSAKTGSNRGAGQIESVDCSGVRNHEWDAAMGVG